MGINSHASPYRAFALTDEGKRTKMQIHFDAKFEGIILSGIANELRDAARAVAYHDQMPGHQLLATKQAHLKLCFDLALLHRAKSREIKYALDYARPQLEKLNLLPKVNAV